MSWSKYPQRGGVGWMAIVLCAAGLIFTASCGGTGEDSPVGEDAMGSIPSGGAEQEAAGDDVPPVKAPGNLADDAGVAETDARADAASEPAGASEEVPVVAIATKTGDTTTFASVADVPAGWVPCRDADCKDIPSLSDLACADLGPSTCLLHSGCSLYLTCDDLNLSSFETKQRIVWSFDAQQVANARCDLVCEPRESPAACEALGSAVSCSTRSDCVWDSGYCGYPGVPPLPGTEPWLNDLQPFFQNACGSSGTGCRPREAAPCHALDVHGCNARWDCALDPRYCSHVRICTAYRPEDCLICAPGACRSIALETAHPVCPPLPTVAAKLSCGAESPVALRARNGCVLGYECPTSL